MDWHDYRHRGIRCHQGTGRSEGTHDFGRGEIDFLYPENAKVLAFIRHDANEKVLVVANLSRFAQSVSLDLHEHRGSVPVELFGGNEFPAVSEGSYQVTLGAYGVMVNLVKWDFSKLLGIYVAIFACVSVLWGRFVFKEDVPLTTWIGLSVIVAGGVILQFGHHLDGTTSGRL